MTNGRTHLSTWISDDAKRRFAAVAGRVNLSESALLKKLVDDVLFLTGGEELSEPIAPSRGAREARLTIRLEPDDRMLLRERAAARGMPSATYISVLVRSHLRHLAPLPTDELAALKRIVSSLDVVGRNLNRMAEAANRGTEIASPVRDHVELMLKLCTAVDGHVKGLIRKNVASWQVGYDQENG